VTRSGVIALAADLGLDVAHLSVPDRLGLARHREREVPILLDDRDNRLARHVSAADEDLSLVELGGVEEFAPAHLRAMEVGGEKDPRHVLSLHENLADLALEACNVASHAVLGPRSVAGQHRAQQLDVLDDRLAQTHLVVEAEVPEPQAQVQVSLERALQEGVPSCPVDLAMDPLVEAHELTLVGRSTCFEDVEKLLDPSTVGRCDSLRREPCRMGLEQPL